MFEDEEKCLAVNATLATLCGGATNCILAVARVTRLPPPRSRRAGPGTRHEVTRATEAAAAL